MKKFLGILLMLCIALSCAAVASAEVKVDPALYPVVPNDNPFIKNPTTYCNPISLTRGSERVLTTGEPVVRVFNGDYYLITRGQRGYWWSPDFVEWTYVDAPNYVGGIPGWVEIDGKLYGYCGNNSTTVVATDDPKTGIWYEVGQFATKHNNGLDIGGYGDASMLYDEETGRLFMFYGWSQILGIRVVEIDKNTWQEIGEPRVAIYADPHNHGWETRYAEDNIFPLAQITREYRPEEYGWTEGGHPLKYNGKYYLMYASIGLEFFSYGHGVYVADDPMGPYTYLEDNPLTMQTTTVVPGAGHGSIWTDKGNNVWTICMLPYALNRASGNTLMSLYPSGVTEEGVMYGVEEHGDLPQYLPGVVEDPAKNSFTGWLLLTLDKKVEVSSERENCYAAYAVDEDAKNFWAAETGDPGEYITVDIGEVADIRGIQILWDRVDAAQLGWGAPALEQYQSYTVEVSDDNENWTLIIDKSNNTEDLRSDYIELPTPVYARYIKLTNVFTPDEGKFAVKALRAFGNPDKATFTKVENVTVMRDKLDRRKASIVWEQVDGAEGYIVRYGVDPNRLFNSYTIYWDNYLNIKSLNVDPEYYFEVEAFSSGTPRYVENTFATRGRGAEMDLTKTASDGTRTTERIMTYETYGVDEVYTFDNITPGTYRLAHTFGVGIWGPVELTEADLIGTGTEPTIEALGLSTFGNGSTQWGTVNVRVYPGETSGKIVLTLEYDCNK